MTATGISERKRVARADAVRRRDAAFAAPECPQRLSAANDLLQETIRALSPETAVLAGYLAIRSEADPQTVMAAHSGPVCVPAVKGPGQALEFHRWTPDAEMRAGPFGVMVPAHSDPLVPQVLIVPGLAFDAQGYRLGYGGGFYDRTLAALRAQGPVVAIGFAFAAQLVEAVPRDDTDAMLDALVSDAGALVFTRCDYLRSRCAVTRPRWRG